MEECRAQEDANAVATGQKPMTDDQIMEEVLGHRSGYHRGMGYGAPIPEARLSYYEQPRDETLVHSDGDLDALWRKVHHMERLWEMQLGRPPMQPFEQHTSHSQPTPHMSGPPSGPDLSYQSQRFTSFTGTAPPPQPWYGQDRMSGQIAGQHGIPTQHPTDHYDTPGTSGEQQRHPHASGFAPWSSSGSAFHSTSQNPPSGSYPFHSTVPPSSAGPSQPYHPPPYGYHQSPPSTVSASSSQTACGTGSTRVQQRQSNRRR